ncbi:MAG: hypothetical protein JWP08_4027 [Bryobacterales bacterium]|nr:hypothetical protein [Bryobacterales bacterium]
MTPAPRQYVRVLGVVPCPKGFGFAVLENGQRLLDWGVARLYSQSDEEFLDRVESFARRYKITVIAFEATERTRRGVRAKRQLMALTECTRSLQSTRKAIAIDAAQKALNVTTRKDLANIVANWFPELHQHLPAVRKPWQSEDTRMSMFVAAFVAVCTARVDA